MTTIVIKATLVLLLGLVAAWMTPRARASMRHLVLAATLLSVLALPIAARVVPAVELELDVPHVSLPSASPSAAPEGTSPGQAPPAIAATTTRESHAVPALTAWLGATWATGFALLLTSLSAAVWRLARLRRRGVPALEMRALIRELGDAAGVRRPVDVMFHEGLDMPLTCGVLRHAILLPSAARSWTAADTRRALVHELEHVRRGDWIVQIVARVACAAYWFHPLVWVAWRGLRLEAERACDDAVIQASGQMEYAEQLVMLAERARSHVAHPVLAMARRSDLSARISALLDTNQKRGRVGTLSAATALVVTSALVLTIAPVRAVQAAARDGATATREDGGEQRPVIRVLVARSDRALYRAAERGDLMRMKVLLEGGANVNAAIDGDGSPLIGASRAGQLEAVRLLLNRGADPNMPVPGDGSPLIAAAGEGYVAIVEVLLDRGANIDQIVPADENALIQASGEGHLDVVKLLVARGANVNAAAWAPFSAVPSNGEWRTPLSMARRGGHEAVVLFLLSVGAHQ